jgi:fatty acid desaturase
MFELTTKNVSEPVTLKQLPTLRQTFVAAASLIIAGYVLAYYVNENFIYLPLLVAGGLLFSGIVGVCPMVHIIQKMPWNKRR